MIRVYSVLKLMLIFFILNDSVKIYWQKKIQVDLLELIWNGKAIATKSLKQKSKKKKNHWSV